jgi:hypothetical protein
MSRHHLIISGTGRAGTTFLVQLLTELGLDTGFTGSCAEIDPIAHAGLEHDLRAVDAPYVVKSPWLCDQLDELLARGDIRVDHAIIPVRDLSSAAKSRSEVHKRAGSPRRASSIRGGGPSSRESSTSSSMPSPSTRSR